MVPRSLRSAGALLMLVWLLAACAQTARPGLAEHDASLEMKIGQMLMVGFQGSEASDTSHVGMADVTDTWHEIALEPYRHLAQGSLPFAVMTAHVVNRHLDEQWPATLSSRIQGGILRRAHE